MLVIRPAEPDDLPSALEILDRAQRSSYGVSDNWEHYVVLADRASPGIHGLSGLEVHGTVGVVRSVVVAPSARNHGYGRRLVEAVACTAWRQGLSDLFLITCQAAHFYRRLRFQSVPRSQCPSHVLRSLCSVPTATSDATVMHRLVVPPAIRISDTT
jgi:N-acetylglutamate synthase-like GNAT family acetyltransferase